ncbi:MAG: glycosyltransferase family 4 protein [Heyndrickxia oleronia]|uniref:glycosyltransferase family 4 protein n=1 Tax=Heyndrickxia oleronia TaxID=38875 RepID=UPI00242BCBE4|nr:glycosyltransferase family 4 protein [Heyndrickxia oleronia]MCI1590677.1 glycosyltransferase family 4 protein [Heyndrickxia oleronia]MCI1612134.1 glycosyltransferase family 4 protein [Heyndrickxia oleronia]
MNVLFLTLSSMENINERGIYTDLVRELASRGIYIHVVFPRERRLGLPTELEIIDNIKLLKVKTGNITETRFIEKGISTLTIENQYLKAVKKYFGNINFDLIIYSTPPITFERVIQYLKKKHQSKTYLILKDIFPQNAVDIDILKNNSFIWKYFRNKEKHLYEVSDMIGCMTKGNVQYILNHNPYIDRNKVEVFPNSIEPIDRNNISIINNEIKEKFQIPAHLTLFIYGGNLGKPQGIDFLIRVAENFYKIENSYLLIVGSGTEYETIKNYIDSRHPKNVNLIKSLPKKEYDQLLRSADVGLIFLDKRFTIPNFPSRLTSYFEYSLPVLAATDKHTDLKNILIESNSGFWCESGDLDSFIHLAKSLADNNVLRKQMGLKGRDYLEDNYDIRKTANIIMKHL